MYNKRYHSVAMLIIKHLNGRASRTIRCVSALSVKDTISARDEMRCVDVDG